MLVGCGFQLSSSSREVLKRRFLGEESLLPSCVGERTNIQSLVKDYTGLINWKMQVLPYQSWRAAYIFTIKIDFLFIDLDLNPITKLLVFARVPFGLPCCADLSCDYLISSCPVASLFWKLLWPFYSYEFQSSERSHSGDFQVRDLCALSLNRRFIMFSTVGS